MGRCDIATRGDLTIARYPGGARLSLGEIIVQTSTQSDRVVIDRGPAPSCHFYYSVIDGTLLAFSDLDLAGPWLGPLRIDTIMVALGLLYRDNRADRTALDGIHELRAGERLIWSRGQVEIVASWSPWEHIASANDMDGAFRTGIREAVLQSVGELASRNSHLLVEMSGGLDSSIIACALRHVGADFSMLLYVPFGPEGDERRFAQMVADHVQRPLHILFPDGACVDVTRSNAAHVPRPSTRSFTQEFDRLATGLADRIDATCVVNGAGGDAVFGSFR